MANHYEVTNGKGVVAGYGWATGKLKPVVYAGYAFRGFSLESAEGIARQMNEKYPTEGPWTARLVAPIPTAKDSDRGGEVGG